MFASYPLPVATNLSRQDIEIIAENIAAQLEYRPGDDLEPVVSKLGGSVKIEYGAGLFDSDSGSLLVHKAGKFEIFLSSNTSHMRDRFTIAHELGHYVLHFLYPRQIGSRDISQLRATRYGSDRYEWEANWFAAAFLMPKEIFEEEFRISSGNTLAISTKFMVSTRAAEIRSKVLNLQ